MAGARRVTVSSARMLELAMELILELFGEGLLDVALHAVGESERARRRARRIVLFAFVGAGIGALSLLVFPELVIADPTLRVSSLVLSPLLAGLTLAIVGRRRRRDARLVTSLESFWPAFTFALAMAAVRYFGAA